MGTSTESPRVLVIGHGHGGGSAARAAAAFGLETEIWGRSDLARSNPVVARALVGPNRHVRYRKRDVDDGGSNRLAEELEPFDWVVLAHEPRPLGRTTADGVVERAMASATRLYAALGAAGFVEGRGAKRIVRLGSPPAERPAVELGEMLTGMPYFRVKRALGELASVVVAAGLPLSTVAPAEIHSPWSASGDQDPYRLALGASDRVRVIHDLPAAAVSDESVGNAVLAALVGAEPGGWHFVADGVLGPGRATERMARIVGSQANRVVTWQPEAAVHLIEILEHGREPDLDLLARSTSGLNQELASAQAAAEFQRDLSAAAFWWAGPAGQARARAAASTFSTRAGAAMIRSLTDGTTTEMLAVLVAMGASRPDQDIGQLVDAVEAGASRWADRLRLRPDLEERSRRLDDALRRRASVLSGSWQEAVVTGPTEPVNRS